MEDKILVNDMIVIDKHNAGYNYYSYFEFFDIYEPASELRENFGDSLVDHINRHNSKENYRCLFKAPDPHDYSTILYIIQGDESKKIFLIDDKAVFNHYHTDDSYDNTDIIIEKLAKSDMELREKLFRQQLDITALKLRIKSLSKEYEPNSEMMPPLENGMFGIVKHLCDNVYVPFCVVNDFIVYAKEYWDDVKTFDIYGESEFSKIVRLYKDVRSFDFAEELFKRGDTEKLIWRSKEYEH